MKWIINTVLFILLSAACGPANNEEVTYPPHVLRPDEMADIIADFALAESASNINILGVAPHKADSAYNFDPLAERQISKSRYDSSMDFYIKHPKIYRSIYEKALEKLTELQAARDTVKSKANQ
jgi:hypothetical protein